MSSRWPPRSIAKRSREVLGVDVGMSLRGAPWLVPQGLGVVDLVTSNNAHQGRAADGEEVVRVAADVSQDLDVVMPNRMEWSRVGKSWSPHRRPAWST